MSVVSVALLALAPAAGAADGWQPRSGGGGTARLELTEPDRVGFADITVHPQGGGWDVDALVTKTTDEPGCVFLQADDAPTRTRETALAPGQQIGAQCGSAGTRTQMLTHTEHRRLVLGWTDGDGVPVSWRTVTV
ncbi:hypothetical protein [Streptomyces sp. MI02-7b]|uniref:hypothetical protein n=1 Tax=Streptomyces sp. MI02-7b TaxID=462941 RepID=UPI0029B1C4BB|nr:hypothetical protein [Streptomyces sp. MI02-7b]MDX3076247.1 hypothetical protein [Streptomyces sp. MI02-7b]